MRRGNKEKDSIFDELVSRKSGGHPLVGGGGGGRVVGGAATGFMFGHPLPLPSEISLQGVPAGFASSSASASSNSSSGSSDERPDLASYRYFCLFELDFSLVVVGKIDCLGGSLFDFGVCIFLLKIRFLRS